MFLPAPGHPALQLVVDVVAALLAAHALLKLVFFLLPYRVRRGALDRSYGDKATATRASDAMLLAVVIFLSGLMLWRGVEPASFVGGLWIGATLIQLCFHRFGDVLSADRAPRAPVSPIKMMSYAIQAAPQRLWREMLMLAVLLVCGLVLLGRRHL